LQEVVDRERLGEPAKDVNMFRDSNGSTRVEPFDFATDRRLAKRQLQQYDSQAEFEDAPYHDEADTGDYYDPPVAPPVAPAFAAPDAPVALVAPVAPVAPPAPAQEDRGPPLLFVDVNLTPVCDVDINFNPLCSHNMVCRVLTSRKLNVSPFGNKTIPRLWPLRLSPRILWDKNRGRSWSRCFARNKLRFWDNGHNSRSSSSNSPAAHQHRAHTSVPGAARRAVRLTNLTI